MERKSGCLGLLLELRQILSEFRQEGSAISRREKRLKLAQDIGIEFEMLLRIAYRAIKEGNEEIISETRCEKTLDFAKILPEGAPLKEIVLSRLIPYEGIEYASLYPDSINFSFKDGKKFELIMVIDGPIFSYGEEWGGGRSNLRNCLQLLRDSIPTEKRAQYPPLSKLKPLLKFSG